MRKSLAAVAVFATLANVSLAGAAGIHQRAPYQAFGNLSGVGDCGYESDANLVLHRWPRARITTDEVESAYDNLGNLFAGTDVTTDGGEIWTAQGLWTAQNYLLSKGFGGHRATSIVQVTTRATEIASANDGGLEVVNEGPVRMHVFDIIAANRTHVVIVDDGYVYHYSWAWLDWAYTQNSETLSYYAVTW
jgi:hypothetical protein